MANDAANSNWLVDYVEKTRHQEAPTSFHLWTGITIIAATLGRKVWLARRAKGVTYFNEYPGQIMTVLVADSGLVRKTTAIQPAEDYLRFIGKKVIQGKSSVEAFLMQMDPNSGGDPNAVLIEGELTNFVSKASYVDPLVDVLMALADGRKVYDYNTLGKGIISIPEPSLTILSATTPETMGSRLPPSATGAGLMSRIICPYAKETDRMEDLSDVEDEDVTQDELQNIAAVEQRLKAGLVRINSMAGPFTFSKEGRIWWREFYDEWRKSPIGQGAGYPARRPSHLLRVSMCIAAADSQSMILTDHHLKTAHKLLQKVEKDHDKAFAYIGTAYTKDRQRIVDFIAAKAGKVTIKELYAAMYPYFKDLDTLNRTLVLLEGANVLKQRIDSTVNPPMTTWELSGVSFNI